MCLGILANKDKIGNLMVLLAERLNPLYHTKLIKLIYLIDEAAIKDGGVPVTWLDYQLWQHGPVAPETYYIKQRDNNIFSQFITAEKTESGTLIKQNKAFCEDKFSDYELSIINGIVEKYHDFSCQDLVDVTHEEGSLWSITKEENDEDFEIVNTTAIKLDLKRLIDNDINMQNYEGAEETMIFNSPYVSSLAN